MSDDLELQARVARAIADAEKERAEAREAKKRFFELAAKSAENLTAAEQTLERARELREQALQAFDIYWGKP